ncbi:MAG: lysophospholipid acyltransferase family protein [Candidatus Lindowbacteria bacterium]|nr:lysophospholipid acyltransferase family protein [Candidatus Lindowbacteria bacterium]
MRIRSKGAARAAAFFGAVLLRLLNLTWTFKYKNMEVFEKHFEEGGVILPFWHNKIIGSCIAPVWRKYDTVVIVSQHFDGEIIALLNEYIGHRAVRASTGKEGVRGLSNLATDVKDGCVVGITPDGPRGPRYQAQAGVAILAKFTSRPVIPTISFYQKRWKFNSWDGFEFSKPFSEITVVFGDVIFHEGEINDTRERIEVEMKRMVEDGEALYGRLPDFVLDSPKVEVR